MNKYDLNIMRYDVLFNKYKTMSEMCDLQTLQNYRESKLKVISEAGTVEDLGWLYKEAADENEAKQKNIIARMIDALIKFIKSVLDKLRALFGKTEEEVQQLPPEKKSLFAKITGVITGAASAVLNFGNSIVEACKDFVHDVLNGDKKAIALAITCGAAVSVAIAYGGRKGYKALKARAKVKEGPKYNYAASTTYKSDDLGKYRASAKKEQKPQYNYATSKNTTFKADDDLGKYKVTTVDNADEVNSTSEQVKKTVEDKGAETTGAEALKQQKKTEQIIAKIKDIAADFGGKVKDSKLAQNVTSILHSIIDHLKSAGSTISGFVGGALKKVKGNRGSGNDETKEENDETETESAFYSFDDDDDFDLFNESDNSSFEDAGSEFDYLFDDFVL
jgi:hypothetical protein